MASIASGNKDVLNISVDSAQLSPETYLIEFNGRANVYTIRYQRDNKMQLSTIEQESFIDYDTGERIDRLKWTFKKK